jgi:hypothetical protein
METETLARYEPAIRIFAIAFAIFILLYIARQVTTATWFWGGTDCYTTSEIMACTGILPVGIMLTVVMGVILGSTVVELGKRGWRRLA